MNEQKNVDIVRKGYEAFGRGDIEALLSLFADDIEWITPGPSELRTAGNRRGRDQVREFFATVDELFEIQQFEPTTFVAQGDMVVVMGEDRARFKPTGQTLQEAWSHTFTIKDGKVHRFREYMDTSAVVAELKGAQART